MKKDPEDPSVMLEPYEEVNIEVDLSYTALIIEKMNNRKGVLLNTEENSEGK